MEKNTAGTVYRNVEGIDIRNISPPSFCEPSEDRVNGAESENPPEEISPEIHEKLEYRVRMELKEELDKEKERFLSELTLQKEAYLREAREEIEKEKEKARQEGFEKGRQEGLEKEQERALEQEKYYRDFMKESGDEIEKALKEIEREKEKNLEKYLDELLEVSLSVAEKIIRVSLRVSSDVIKRMILHEAEKLKNPQWIRVKLVKEDYERLMQSDQDIAKDLSVYTGKVSFDIIEGQTGDIFLESDRERVDLSIGKQLENIREGL